MTDPSWADRVLAWFDQHGRRDLPWQHPRSAYRVWVSEIMLQQTTVATVIPYFKRFMERLPDVHALAAAPSDELMALWSGLGYYARARNLHKAAQLVVEQHAGEFPQKQEALEALPGIGRSTAAAIRAQAFAQPAAILDGNVKRLLARHAGVVGWPGQTAVQNRLWSVAEDRLPDGRPADYAQAMMDLGATVCRRSRPDCEACPVQQDCEARQQDRIAELPGRKPRKEKPKRVHWYLLLRDEDGRILLEKRPPAGIWGGLWALPEAKDSPDEFAAWVTQTQELARHDHEFSHFSLQLRLLKARLSASVVQEEPGRDWHTVARALQLGLPQPIRLLIETYCA